MTVNEDELKSENAGGTAARRARLAERTATRTEPPKSGDPGGRQPLRGLDPARLASLEGERDFLLASLDDLEREHECGDVDEEDYDQLRNHYTARAASVLTSIESKEALIGSESGSRRAGASWLVCSFVVLVAVALGFFVAQNSGRRGPGDSISGDIRQSSRDQLLSARGLYSQGRYPDAIKVYDKVLEQKPNDVEALSYRGWLLRLVSSQTQDPAQIKVLLGGALESLDRAVAVDPRYPDARVFRAVVLRDLGRPQLALDDLARLEAGAVPTAMSALVDNLRRELVDAAKADASHPTTTSN